MVKLDRIIPRKGKGWKNGESFAFEFDFWPKKVSLKSVIAPGDTQIRDILYNSISRVKGTTEPRGAQWLVQYKYLRIIDITDEKYENDQLLIKELNEILDKEVDTINQIEEEILKDSQLLI